MAKSPLPGKCSSNPSDGSDARQALKDLKTYPALKPIIAALADQCDLYIVGGTVRDVLQRGSFNPDLTDIDLASHLPPEKAKSLLESAGLKVIDTGLQHGTVTILSNDEHIELTTFRSAGIEQLPLEERTIHTDLAGRDFTINALAFNVASGEILDPYDGEHDLRSSLLKAVGSAAERFAEDPLRILRLIRFGPAADRAVDKETLAAARSLSESLLQVSVERIREELVQILLSQHAVASILMMHDLQLLVLVLPELVECMGVEQNEFHIHDVFEHTLAVIEKAPSDKLLRLTALFHDLGKPASLSVAENGRRHFYRHEMISDELCQKIMQRLKFSKKETADVSTLVRFHMRPLDCGPSAVRRLMRDLGPLFEPWLEFKVADAPPVQPEEEFQALLAAFKGMVAHEDQRQSVQQASSLTINGHDLIALGCAPGPAVGEVISALQEAVLDDPGKNDPEILKNLALDYLKSRKGD